MGCVFAERLFDVLFNSTGEVVVSLGLSLGGGDDLLPGSKKDAGSSDQRKLLLSGHR